jgi:tetratricopeptide (TPR) repeat protein
MRRSPLLVLVLFSMIAPVSHGQTINAAKSYLDRGLTYFAKGELDKAIDDFGVAITFDPGYAAAYYNRGNAKQSKKDMDGAIADYTSAVEINPRFLEAYANRGAARFVQGDIDGAVADSGKAISINPRLAEPYNTRGLARHSQGDLAGAVADFSRAVAADRRYAVAYFNRGRVLHDKGELVGAIADFSVAIKLNPHFALAYANRGLTKLLQGKSDEAARDFDQCLRSDDTLRPLLAERVEQTRRSLAISFPNATGSTTGTKPTATVASVNSTGTAHYSLSNNLGAFEIATYAASPSQPVTVCFQVLSVNDPSTFGNLCVMNVVNGVPVDATTSHDFATRTICASVTSSSPVVIVKGAADQIADLIRLVRGFNLQRGIENSLDAKLQNAQDALTAVRSGNKSSACNLMASFIIEAHAQSGKALTVAEANQLIAAARQIRATLGCQ